MGSRTARVRGKIMGTGAPGGTGTNKGKLQGVAWCRQTGPIQTGQSRRPVPMKPRRSEEGGNVIRSRLGSTWSPHTLHNSVMLQLTPVSDSSSWNDAFCHHPRAPTHCQD